MNTNHLLSQAVTLHQAGRRQDAAHLYLAVLRHRADHADARHNLGLVALQGGDLTAGISLVRAALTLDPSYGRYWLSLVQALADADRLGEARRSLPRAMRLAADQGWCGALAARLFGSRQLLAEAQSRHRRGRTKEAHTLAKRVLSLLPTSTGALEMLGHFAGQGVQREVAAPLLERGLRLDDHAAGLNARQGQLLLERGHKREAFAASRRSLALDPATASALATLGRQYWEAGQANAGERMVGRSLAADPEDPHSRHYLIGYLLNRGRFPEAWDHYEWRLLDPRLPGGLRKYRQHRWNGEPLGERVLLVYGEQGFGDVMQFSRFAVEAARHGRVILEVWPKLVGLLSGLPGIERVIPSGGTPPDFDVHCPLLSLPRVFRSRLDTLPPLPPLTVDPMAVSRWQRLIGKTGGLKVGLVWAGGPKASPRSMAFRDLAPLLRVNGVRWFSLQLGEPAQQRPDDGAIVDLSANLTDFTETAAALKCLDLVITIDTAMAHLGGILGRPAWVMLSQDCDWRWKNPSWYPTARLFRHDGNGPWTGVVHQVAKALAETVGSAAA